MSPFEDTDKYEGYSSTDNGYKAIGGCTNIVLEDDPVPGIEWLTFCFRRWHSVQDAAGRVVFPTLDTTMVRGLEQNHTNVSAQVEPM